MGDFDNQYYLPFGENESPLKAMTKSIESALEKYKNMPYKWGGVDMPHLLRIEEENLQMELKYYELG